jgi:hypothetical protein
MKILKLRMANAMLIGATTFFLAGCKPAQQVAPPESEGATSVATANTENQQVAETVLGKQAEIVSHGDLALNGSEQLLVVNRFGKGDAGPGSPIFLTRAVIVEKSNDRWAEVLRCDDHLKNPRGYLGGSPVSPVTGWRLELKQDTDQGLELRFTPAASIQETSSGAAMTGSRTITVRWNKKAKRYQSLDQSHREYLGDVPTLETPQSILK